MGSAIGNLLAFMVAISVLVAVHEYGHYIVGRWTGMKVLRFSIGFGRPVWSRIGGKDRTEYCISAIPLGGYVRFLDTREGPIPEEDEGRAFNQRPIPHRIAVLLAGPFVQFPVCDCRVLGAVHLRHSDARARGWQCRAGVIRRGSGVAAR